MVGSWSGNSERVAEWGSAIGTVGTLVATLIIVRRDRRKADAERDALADERQQSQARRVFAWSTGGGSGPDGVRLSCEVRNMSDAPIFNCKLGNADEVSEGESQAVQVTPIIEPHSPWSGYVRTQRLPADGEVAHVELYFTDGSRSSMAKAGRLAVSTGLSGKAHPSEALIDRTGDADLHFASRVPVARADLAPPLPHLADAAMAHDLIDRTRR
jgi:hypothetical protein